MKVLFPDGNLIDMAHVTQVGYDISTNTIMVLLEGYAAVYSYIAFTAFEMMTFHNIVRATSSEGDGQVILPSFAPIPAAGDVTVTTDTGGNIAVAGGNLVLLTIAVPSPLPMVKSFIPENFITINSKPATGMSWVSGFALMFLAPPNAAGAYNIVYEDRRGTFTKASVTYA